jgi:hypothetical protein
MQQHLLAFQVLQPAARSPNVKGWTSRRFLGVPGQIWNLQPLRRKVGERADQPDAFFRQRKHEEVMRGCHGAYQGRQMKSVRHFGQRFWPVRKAKHSRHVGACEYPQPIRLIVPELIDRVRLRALELSDLVFILNVALRAGEMLEPLFEIGELVLIDTGFLQLRQCLLGEVLELRAIGLDVLDQGRDRQVQ